MFFTEFFPLIPSQRKQLKENYRILQQVVDLVATEYQQKPYEDLLLPAEHLSMIRVINGQEFYFSAEAYTLLKDGTLCFCIDVKGLPTLFGIKPSYHFYMRPDGSIYF